MDILDATSLGGRCAVSGTALDPTYDPANDLVILATKFCAEVAARLKRQPIEPSVLTGYDEDDGSYVIMSPYEGEQFVVPADAADEDKDQVRQIVVMFNHSVQNGDANDNG